MKGDWQIPIREALMKGEGAAELKVLKDYALMRGKLYRRMLGGFLSRCVGQDEAQKKLKEVYDKTCGSCGKVSLYRRLQRVGFYWPNMSKDADRVQTQCGTCQLATNREESYAVFISEDWRSPFVQYLAEAFCYKGIVKDTSLGGWQRVTFCIIRSFSKKGTMVTP